VDTNAAKWITFDCYGTLVDWNGGFRNILQRVAGERVDELIAAYHRFERMAESETPHRFYREVLATALQRAADSCGISLAEDKRQIIADSWTDMRPFPDIEDELARLRADGFNLGVLTNCDDDLFKLTHQQFDQPFDRVITAEQVQDYKPSLSHFRRFQRQSGVANANWIHAACSWFHDMVPASRLGIASIWVDRDRTGDDPSYATARISSAAGLRESARRLSS
jgi:2-haloacid dehalogenase